jgi:uncharacterized protein (TIGR03083 family)
LRRDRLIEGANKFSLGNGLVMLAKNGFDMNKSIAASAIEAGKHSTDDLLRAMRETVSMRNTPPPTKAEDRLYDTVVHTQDIRRATGAPGSVPEARVRIALERLKNIGSILGAKKRIAGLTLVATDMEWTHGEGPDVHGTTLVVFERRTLAAAGFEVVPTFRSPHATIAFTDIEAVTRLLDLAHVRRENAYHDPDSGDQHG